LCCLYFDFREVCYTELAMDNRGAIFLAGLVIISAIAIASILRSDGQMIFPKPSHGFFIRKPEIFIDGDTRRMRWTLPERCARSSFEIQEVGYVQGSDMGWGGGDATCVSTEKGYECRSDFYPGMNGNDKKWKLQASAYECDSGRYYVSDATIVQLTR